MRPRLAFVSHSTNVYYQEVLLGIIETLEREGLFDLQIWQGHHLIQPAALKYVPTDAVVTTVWDYASLPDLPRNTPVIGISNAKQEAEFARIVNDDRAIGRLAAETMRDAGYERLVILNNLDHHHVRLRCAGVAEVAAQHNLPLQTYNLALRRPQVGEPFLNVLEEFRLAVEEKIRNLLPGTGFLAVQSNAAGEFLNVLEKKSQWRVPEEIGFLVMDQIPQDEQRLAHLELNGKQIGRLAVRSLGEQLRNSSLPSPVTCQAVPPREVRFGQTLRQGEGIQLFQKMRQHYQENLAEDIQVENVARMLGLSRRSLELKLRACHLPAPYELLTNLRLKRSEELLKKGNRPIEEIAESCGFANARSLTERFRAVHGMTPFAYRKRSRQTSLNSP